MSWIKEANKKGRYKQTHKGFRIYVVVECSSKISIVERNGESYNCTEITKGVYYAVDKNGVEFNGWLWDIIHKIDKEDILKMFQRWYREELEWK